MRGDRISELMDRAPGAAEDSALERGRDCGAVQSGSEMTAVDGLDLTIGSGDSFFLLGVNGAGKTTTVKMLCGFAPARAVTVLLVDSALRACS